MSKLMSVSADVPLRGWDEMRRHLRGEQGSPHQGAARIPSVAHGKGKAERKVDLKVDLGICEMGSISHVALGTIQN